MSGRLILFGDSNTYGHGLSDCIFPGGYPGHNPSNLVWGKILADKMNREYVNCSRPGSSNKEILWQILNFDSEFTENDIVIVLWSLVARHCIIQQPYPNEPIQLGPWFYEQTGHQDYHVGISWLETYDEHDAKIESMMYSNHAKLYLARLGITSFQYNMINPEYPIVDWNTVDFSEIYFWTMTMKYQFASDGVHRGIEAQSVYAKAVYNDIKDKI